MKMGLLGWIYKLSRWFLGGVFIYAGSAKLLEPMDFAFLMAAYGIVPEVLLMPAALVLPTLEVAAGIGLLFDIAGSLEAIAGLLMLFIAILAYGLWLGLDVDCGCFGPQDPEAAAFHGLRLSLYRDLMMLGGVAFIYGWRRYHTFESVKIRDLFQTIVNRRRTNDARL